VECGKETTVGKGAGRKVRGRRKAPTSNARATGFLQTTK
jgi:hypothetical protein